MAALIHRAPLKNVMAKMAPVVTMPIIAPLLYDPGSGVVVGRLLREC
jgi:hypothetical protein